MTPLRCVLRTDGCGRCWEAKDAEVETLQAGLDAARERGRWLKLRLAELERGWGWTARTPGTPSSKERIGTREEWRHGSERERRKDPTPGGQSGHPGKSLARDPDPGGSQPDIGRNGHRALAISHNPANSLR
jgi:hypothetical protein